MESIVHPQLKLVPSMESSIQMAGAAVAGGLDSHSQVRVGLLMIGSAALALRRERRSLR
jgi:hypothetical protein